MVEYVVEKWNSEIATVTIGATPQEGGTRSKVLKIGGQKTLPFLKFEGTIPNKPAIVAEIVDYLPEDLWPSFYKEFKDIVIDPIKWLKKIEETQPDAVCIRLLSCHPDIKNNSKEYLKSFIPEIIKTTTLPLIILGCEHPEKDTEILPYVCELAKGERILVGMAIKENYKIISLAAFECGHSIIAQTPLDINLAKQLNILINDIGIPLDRIVMHHTTGGLGYGLEYCYSIMERTRLAGLQGDKIMALPIINLVAEETWKTKETKISKEEPNWEENEIQRGIVWEMVTSFSYLQAGSDILVISHPQTIINLKRILNQYI